MKRSIELVLASASPRRRALLVSAGLAATVKPQDVDESPFENESPMAYALRTATVKALACDRAQDQVILAADTVVAFDGTILGKPVDDDDARRMLRELSGKTHVVHTAVVAVGSSMLSDLVSTKVQFRLLSETHISHYVSTGDGRDKAGAYGIQGEGGALVDRVEGSYTNVVGLPLKETLGLMRLLGVKDE